MNAEVGLGGKVIIALESAPKWALPARRVGVGDEAWGASLWMGVGALSCMDAELESPQRELRSSGDVAHIGGYRGRSATA